MDQWQFFSYSTTSYVGGREVRADSKGKENLKWTVKVALKFEHKTTRANQKAKKIKKK